jgi:ubiquinone/menaquinone biosynthesis C-methylase UbiE/uncharacterized protein YbaR (Trm112 family)
MLESVISAYLLCANCLNGPLRVMAFGRNGDEVANGMASCDACQSWYRIEEGLLELLPATLRDAHSDRRFLQRFAAAADVLAFMASSVGSIDEGSVAHKLGQKHFYDEDAIRYETQMMKLPFWKAFDRGFIDDIRRVKKNDAGAVLLEIGCGTGRFSLPLSGSFRQILSFDISEAMVRTALRKRAEQDTANISYFVADAERIPVRSEIADVALFSGILHHVEHPGEVIGHMARTLKSGGRFIGNENNRSAFRPVFDILMRVRRLWNEKAHEEHFVMSEHELNQWFAGAGVRGRTWTSVFLPPHIYNFLPENAAWRLLRITDAIATVIPWLRSQGGLVLFEGEKP